MRKWANRVVDSLDNPTPRPRERPMPAPTQLFHATYEHQQLKSELAALRQATGGGFLVRVEQVCASPYQVGALDHAAVQDLVEHLRHNPLASPILVRPTRNPQARFEVIAGHKRLEAFRQLGRDEILCTIRIIEDDTAERLVHYDNLLASAMPDFLKYLGFAQRRASRGLSQSEFAQEAGMSESRISRLFSFEVLPARALNILKGAPRAVGAKTAAKLGAYAKTRPDEVVEAVARIAAGKLTRRGALRWLQAHGREEPPRANVLVVRNGSGKFAEVLQRPNKFTIRFADEATALRIQGLVMDLLERESKEEPQ